MKNKIKSLKYGIVILIVAIITCVPLTWKNLKYCTF